MVPSWRKAYCTSFLTTSFLIEGDDWRLPLTTVATFGSAWMVAPSSQSDEDGVDVSAPSLELVAVLLERLEVPRVEGCWAILGLSTLGVRVTRCIASVGGRTRETTGPGISKENF